MSNMIRSRSKKYFISISLALLAAPCSVWAALGESESSVQVDQVRMKAVMRGSAAVAGAYSVHQMQTPAGTMVKEYASPGGTVFAIEWKGPVIPDLRQLLGRHFDTYVNSGLVNRRSHSHVALEQSGLVIRSQGRMRAFSGIAYIPGMVPAGFRLEEIQ